MRVPVWKASQLLRFLFFFFFFFLLRPPLVATVDDIIKSVDLSPWEALSSGICSCFLWFPCPFSVWIGVFFVFFTVEGLTTWKGDGVVSTLRQFPTSSIRLEIRWMGSDGCTFPSRHIFFYVICVEVYIEIKQMCCPYLVSRQLGWHSSEVGLRNLNFADTLHPPNYPYLFY